MAYSLGYRAGVESKIENRPMENQFAAGMEWKTNFARSLMSQFASKMPGLVRRQKPEIPFRSGYPRAQRGHLKGSRAVEVMLRKDSSATAVDLESDHIRRSRAVDAQRHDRDANAEPGSTQSAMQGVSEGSNFGDRLGAFRRLKEMHKQLFITADLGRRKLGDLNHLRLDLVFFVSGADD